MLNSEIDITTLEKAHSAHGQCRMRSMAIVENLDVETQQKIQLKTAECRTMLNGIICMEKNGKHSL